MVTAPRCPQVSASRERLLLQYVLDNALWDAKARRFHHAVRPLGLRREATIA